MQSSSVSHCYFPQAYRANWGHLCPQFLPYQRPLLAGASTTLLRQALDLKDCLVQAPQAVPPSKSCCVKSLFLWLVRGRKGELSQTPDPLHKPQLCTCSLLAPRRGTQRASAAPMLQLWFEGLTLHTAIPKHVGGLHLGTSISPGKQ